MRMQISAPAAEGLALNSVGDSYSRRENDILQKEVKKHAG